MLSLARVGLGLWCVIRGLERELPDARVKGWHVLGCLLLLSELCVHRGVVDIGSIKERPSRYDG